MNAPLTLKTAYLLYFCVTSRGLFIYLDFAFLWSGFIQSEATSSLRSVIEHK